MPTTLSPYPNLEQLKKQAKDLRKAHASGSSEAAKRLQAYLHGFSDLSPDDVLMAALGLRDAQHVIAREHGFAGWQDLLQVVAPKESPVPRQFVVDSVAYGEKDLLAVQLLQAETLQRVDGSKASSIVLLGEDDRIITMSVGEAEGMALSSRLKRQDFPRPLTHDLFAACLGLLNGVVTAVVIHELKETTFLSHVVFEINGERRYLDARPSDSLNLAARQEAPIYVTRALMAEAGRPLSDLPAHLQKVATTQPA